jgi:DNA-binding response OmpR family regulator
MQQKPESSILVVDDNRDFTALVGLLFSDCKVRQAWGSRDALRLARTQPVHLYLLDYHLPDMTGLDICRTLRGFDQNTPVIIFSAEPIDPLQVSDAGADEFILKSGDTALIVNRVKALISKQALSNEKARMLVDAALAQRVKDRAQERATADRAPLSRVSAMRQVMQDAGHRMNDLRALRAESFARYCAWGGARAGFVADWPEVACSLQPTRNNS